MNHRPRARSQPARKWAGLLVALLAVAGMAAACVPATAPAANAPAPAPQASLAPAATVAAVAPTVAAAPSTAPTQAGQAAPAAAQPQIDMSKLPAGVDADGNFYRGDPKAAVKLTDFSDFQ